MKYTFSCIVWRSPCHLEALKTEFASETYSQTTEQLDENESNGQNKDGGINNKLFKLKPLSMCDSQTFFFCH